MVNKMAMMPELATYYVYVLSCEGGSWYTGITTDVERRLHEHLSGGPLAARYTRFHRPVGLVALWETEGRASASRLEYRIKRLSRAGKEELVAAQDAAGEGYVPVPQAQRELMWQRANAARLG